MVLRPSTVLIRSIDGHTLDSFNTRHLVGYHQAYVLQSPDPNTREVGIAHEYVSTRIYYWKGKVVVSINFGTAKKHEGWARMEEIGDFGEKAED